MMPMLSRGIEGSINGLASAIIAIFTGAHNFWNEIQETNPIGDADFKTIFKMVPIFSIEILISKIAFTKWRGQENWWKIEKQPLNQGPSIPGFRNSGTSGQK